VLGTVGPGLLLGSGALFGVSEFGTPTSSGAVLFMLLGAVAVVVGNVYVQAVVVERYLGPPWSRRMWVRASPLYSLLSAAVAWIIGSHAELSSCGYDLKGSTGGVCPECGRSPAKS
jgi:H+/Cl- antiporter ClcA